jgi:hypothetical protein
MSSLSSMLAGLGNGLNWTDRRARFAGVPQPSRRIPACPGISIERSMTQDNWASNSRFG